MTRCSWLYLSLALTLLIPTGLLAGGPPRLCLPLEGVTANSAPGCAQLLSTRLAGSLDKYYGREGVKLLQHEKQWYVTFYMGKPVALSEVESALRGSEFSVPRHKLRLFGHVILKIDTGESSRTGLLKSLAAVDQAAVTTPDQTKDSLLEVTVDMPYPPAETRDQPDTVGWDTFQRSDFSTGSDRTPITPAELPRLDVFREAVKEQGATLKDVVWSNRFACRWLGGVVAEKPEGNRN